MAIKASRLMMLFSSIIFLQIFYLLDLSITNREGVNSPTVIMDLLISPCNLISFGFMYFCPVMLGTYILSILTSSWRINSKKLIPFELYSECPSLSLISYLNVIIIHMPMLIVCSIVFWVFSF